MIQEDNAVTQELLLQLPITLDMSVRNGNEKPYNDYSMFTAQGVKFR